MALGLGARHRARGRDRLVVGMRMEGHERVAQRRSPGGTGRFLWYAEYDVSVSLRTSEVVPGGRMRARTVWSPVSRWCLVAAACGNPSSRRRPTRRPSTPRPRSDHDGQRGRPPQERPGHGPGRLEHRDQGRVDHRQDEQPRPGSYAPLVDGIKAYFAMVNASGGIYGRKLVVATTATTSSARTVRRCRQSLAAGQRVRDVHRDHAVHRRRPAGQGQAAAVHVEHQPRVRRPPRRSSRTRARCASRARRTCSRGSPSSSAPRRSACSRTASRSSRRTARRASRTRSPSTRPRRSCTPTSRSATRRPLGPQVTQMKAKGVQFVMTCVDLQEAFTLAKEMQKQGMNAVQSLPKGYDPDFVVQERGAARGFARRPAVRRPREHAADPGDPEAVRVGGQDQRAGARAHRGRLAARRRVLHRARRRRARSSRRRRSSTYLNTLTTFSDNGFIPPIDWTKAHSDPTNNPAVRLRPGVRELGEDRERQVRARLRPAGQAVGVLQPDRSQDRQPHPQSFVDLGRRRFVGQVADRREPSPETPLVVQQLISNILSGMSYGSVYALLGGRARARRTRRRASSTSRTARRRSSRARSTSTCACGTTWPIPVAFVVAVLIVAPLLGIFLERALFRYLRTATPVAPSSSRRSALLVAIPQILKLWFGQNPQYGTQGIVPNGDHAYNPFGTVFVSRDDLATIGDHAASRSSCSRCCSATPRSVCACAPSWRARG